MVEKHHSRFLTIHSLPLPCCTITVIDHHLYMVHIYIRMHILYMRDYTSTYTYIRVRGYTYIYTHTYICDYIPTHTYIHTWLHIILYIHTYTYTQYMVTYTHTYIHNYSSTHTYMVACTYVHSTCITHVVCPLLDFLSGGRTAAHCSVRHVRLLLCDDQRCTENRRICRPRGCGRIIRFQSE